MKKIIISHANKSEGYLQPLFTRLKHCSRLISNSSMIYYEAKKFLKDEQIIEIGERNKIREEVPIIIGGSDKIIKILEGIDFDKI